MDGFVRNYDPDGNEVWTRQFGSPGDERIGGNGAGATTADGTGVYVVGSTGGTLSGQTCEWRQDAFVRKYGPNGDELWTRRSARRPTRSATGLATGATGTYAVGWTDGTCPDR